MTFEFSLTVSATGNYTEEQLKDYILMELGHGSCSQDNPFVAEEGDATILTIDIY